MDLLICFIKQELKVNVLYVNHCVLNLCTVTKVNCDKMFLYFGNQNLAFSFLSIMACTQQANVVDKN